MRFGFIVTPIWEANSLALVQLRCNVCRRTWSEMPGRFQIAAHEPVPVLCPECRQGGKVRLLLPVAAKDREGLEA